MKIVTVLGARPQFIKAASVSNILRKEHEEIIIHTGQHYDYNMSEQFFKELNIPNPKYNLGISGGTHAQMTGKMMMAIEEVLMKETPDLLLVYGDTNSTLAAALTSAKLHIPICHVEAGSRTHNKDNPEEMNRICTDHLSALLLASTETALIEMQKEGISDRGYFVGDPMYDAFVCFRDKASKKKVCLDLLNGMNCSVPEQFYYLTCHREENTSNDEKLLQIFYALNELDAPTVYPVHPRNKKRAIKLVEQYKLSNLILAEPVGYLDSIFLVQNAKKIITDSGGLQREAFFAGKQCVTVLDFVVWPETMIDNRNQLARPEKDDLLLKLSKEQKIDYSYQPFGDGKAGQKILREINNFFERGKLK